MGLQGENPSGFPAAPADCPSLRPLRDAWALSADLHYPITQTGPGEIEAAEQILDRRLPPELRCLYEIGNGLGLLQGNLVIEPLMTQNGGFGLVRDGAPGSDWYRSTGWSVPPELLIIGGNGSDAMFGMWAPKVPREVMSSPVVAFDMDPRIESLTIMGTSLTRFLTYWSAYYVVLLEGPRAAFEALGAPPDWFDREPDDPLMADLEGWADPRLPGLRAGVPVWPGDTEAQSLRVSGWPTEPTLRHDLQGFVRLLARVRPTRVPDAHSRSVRRPSVVPARP
jgi:hypothetical protein